MKPGRTQAKKKSAGSCELSPVTIIQRVWQTVEKRELNDTKAECQKTQIIAGAFTGSVRGRGRGRRRTKLLSSCWRKIPTIDAAARNSRNVRWGGRSGVGVGGPYKTPQQAPEHKAG